ncbi:Hypothetical predicted protein [Mytilus galloprovincialis]|uniref:WD repeat-containing protein 53 n=1 Tax=Mytilus galloprovincialis TaxID=29158 RepID=A0A8B6CGW0_MYTGA|nr:Hypothetical predicted protein [Mytilus galloprovincialis]
MTATLTGGHTASVLCVDVDKTASFLASGSENGELCIWKSDGSLLKKIENTDTGCTSVCFSKEKENILYVSFDEKIKIYDIKNLEEPVDCFEFNQEEINQIVLDEKEKYLAACDDSGEIKIVDLYDKKVFKTLRSKHTNICSTACFRPRKPWEIITGGLDSKLIHWDFSRPKCVDQFNMQELQSVNAEGDAYMFNPPLVHNLAASLDGHYLAAALENGHVAVFDISRKNIRELYSLHAHSQGTSQVHFLSNKKLISGGNDCSICIWDLEKADQVETESATNGDATSNGHTNGEDVRNESVSEAAKIAEIQHVGKINWMKPFVLDGSQKIAIADQSPNVTILNFELEEI